ncbi:2-oxoacid:acceptor oxidoreductase family protein [Sphingobium sp. Z007]|uniref:2-oxoacid:acceptor oxidoreductase family protein n=1 Tax=Sphingobium sp. Z007 TaxID=627495 RepID=UPI00278C8A66|nr:2-oxoacid:acceptor oxidoreductase family protein [Sphingobium sp. Z007]
MRCVATTDSYYTSSSNVRKQGLLVFHFDATRASVTRELGHFVLFQVRGSDLVRRIGYNLVGREHALLDQSTDPMGSNPKLFGGFGQREPLSILFGGSVAVDFVDSAQRADTARCPGHALSGLHSHPVESGGNVCIGPPGGHGSNDGKGGFGRTLAMFAGPGFANAQLGVLATFPVDRQNDFTLLFIDVSDNISHEGAKELLTTTHVNGRRAPSALQVGGNASKIGCRRGQIDLSRLGQTRFTGFHTPERCFPAILELGSDQAVIRVAGSIATFSERCLVSGLLQVQLHHAVPFFQIIPMRPISFHCGLDRHRRHGSQYLFAYGRVDARCAKSHASWLGQHLVDTFAAVIGMTRRPARIDNAQPIDGPISVVQITHELRGEAIDTIAVVSSAPEKFNISDFAPGTTLHHRDELDLVQRRFREKSGVSVIVYEQTCATELRRRRGKKLAVDPARRVIINDRVCEGCGDCSVQSNCLSVQPLETEFGRKRTIDQSACNKDFSCVKGFCPSFVTVEGGERARPAGIDYENALFDSLPEPAVRGTEKSFGVMVTGIGGTGVVTISNLIGAAAQAEGKSVQALDLTGLAQKFGAVYCHLKVADNADQLRATRLSVGQCDLLIGADLVTAASDESLSRLRSGATVAVVNDHATVTGAFTRDRDFTVPVFAQRAAIERFCGAGRVTFIEATELAEQLTGNTIGANIMLLGFTCQMGWLPVGHGEVAGFV